MHSCGSTSRFVNDIALQANQFHSRTTFKFVCCLRVGLDPVKPNLKKVSVAHQVCHLETSAMMTIFFCDVWMAHDSRLMAKGGWPGPKAKGRGGSVVVMGPSLLAWAWIWGARHRALWPRPAPQTIKHTSSIEVSRYRPGIIKEWGVGEWGSVK